MTDKQHKHPLCPWCLLYRDLYEMESRHDISSPAWDFIFYSLRGDDLIIKTSGKYIAGVDFASNAGKDAWTSQTYTLSVPIYMLIRNGVMVASLRSVSMVNMDRSDEYRHDQMACDMKKTIQKEFRPWPQKTKNQFARSAGTTLRRLLVLPRSF